MITEQKLQELKDKGEVPHFLTVEGFQTLSKGYLQDNETVKERYERVARTICSYMSYSKELEEDIFDVSFNKGWLGFATPILSNSGTEDGLPISCYIMNIDDRMEDIMGRGLGELAMLSKMGGGVGVSFQNIRPSGSFIKKGKGGTSDGIVPFAKVYDSAILASKQPKVRRGNVSLNLSIEHGDALDFIDIRRQEGDPNRQALNIHHCVTISDEFMNRVKDGDKIAQFKFYKLMKARIEKGEPYILYEGNVNSRIPEGYVRNLGLTSIPYTNICSEILKYADAKHTVTCCISSLNLAKYPEWKDWKSPRTGKSLVEITTFALDGVMEEFIQRGKGIPFLDNAIRAAVKDRGIGIGVMGWHTLLQENMIPFESFKAMQLNNEIFKKIDEESRKASQDLALLYGEPEWCRGTGLRNVTRTAIAPTKSNSVINGDVSAGIEPITANCYSEVSPKGTFVRKNKTLISVLEKYNLNDDDTWRSIEKNNGSIKHLPLPEDIKEVFLTAYEINQKAIVQQAAQRTPYICQSQSVNLFFPNTVDPEFFMEVHMLAWELGVKTLYYCKSTKDRVESDNDECKSCHG